MTFDELQNQISENEEFFADRITRLEKKSDEFFSVNDKVAIKIFELSPQYKHENPISIYNQNSIEIGSIFYLNPALEKNILEISDWLYVAYLSDVNVDELDILKYKFKYSYLIIEEQYLEEYLEFYFETAPLWGFLTHKQEHLTTTPHEKESITLRRDLAFPTDLHLNNAIRVLRQPFHFERFLKSYHHLELLFDKIVFDEIKKLNENNLKDFGKLIKSFDEKECAKLFSVLDKKVTDISEIIIELNKVALFKDLAKEVFFEYGKVGHDPLKNDFSLFEAIYDIGFSEENCKTKLHNKADNPTKYRKFILELTAYWIYRIRCSIAHNKIGEFIFQDEDEPFIIEFAEPLLNAVLMQVFKK
ncbi:hypothetical protein RKS58_23655 [Lysinibacillus capsici]|uniref:hypothetical protein n=1 Tax=Lysinibacillus capsici TaxID=2115968 RepID=UPI0028BEAB48|nr:hypothetical protein [Lysinibacillus capsici]WNN76252.1 hypothetical protein RKS58_23655 [Lysinibacillus capsici]